MSIKKEVIEEIKKKAKGEGKTISTFLRDVLNQPYSNKGEKEYSNDIATEMKELKKELKKMPCSNSIATNREGIGLTKEDLKKALLGLENDIDMKIRDMLNEVVNKL